MFYLFTNQFVTVITGQLIVCMSLQRCLVGKFWFVKNFYFRCVFIYFIHFIVIVHTFYHQLHFAYWIHKRVLLLYSFSVSLLHCIEQISFCMKISNHVNKYIPEIDSSLFLAFLTIQCATTNQQTGISGSLNALYDPATSVVAI